ncbi:MAG TPA: DUF58 domain-containing protein [Anaerolineae bacterium]|nr:DUF58 domain-containing protein [Anaerolineae bacterium]
MKIFDGKALRKLEQLTLVADKVRVGVMKGDRRSSKRGTSIEFADYRNYTRGDDLRRLDWNVYARLERPFIKLLEEEEDLAVHILVDTSASMGWPEDEGETHKLNYGLRLAGALGHIGLATGDRVSVTLLGAGGNEKWGPSRGRHNSLRLLQFLSRGEARGVTDLNVSLKDYALRGGRPGLLFLLSDLFSPAGYRDGLNAIQARGFEVGFIHLLSPDEVEPPLAGDVKLVDVETGAGAEISLDSRTVRAYRERFEAWQKELASYCGGRGVHYIPVVTDLPWERLILQTLRARGVVR